MNISRILAFMAALLGLVGIATSPSAAQEQPVVVELFTSQGCSACPPADALLGRMSQDPSIVSISWHVDYWNDLGWKDTLSQADFTNRQKAYREALDVRFVYTPQIVINGSHETVGSKEHKVEALINKSRQPGLAVPLTYKARGGGVEVHIGAGAPKGPATIWLVSTKSSEDVDIGGGENSGRMLTYTNVAKGLRKLGAYTGQPQTVMIPAGDMTRNGADGVALLVQEGDTGPIIGALAIDSSSLK
jgi:hypothetical protein